MADQYQSMALAAVILASVAIVLGSIADGLLLSEYSSYLDVKEQVKRVLLVGLDLKVIKTIVTELLQHVQRKDTDVQARLAALEKALNLPPPPPQA